MAIPFVLIMFVPQLLYWKEMTGHWVHYSYTGETFLYWKNPKMAQVLFDTQNGLFLYSPILLFMFAGLFLARKEPRTNFVAICILFPVITYIFASWCAWWFGAAFGHRCYIEYFPVLAFPMAIAMEKIISLSKLYFKIPIFLIILLFNHYSIGMSYLFLKEGIWDGLEWQWNWSGWWTLVQHAFGI
jgi:hypothetical protein